MEKYHSPWAGRTDAAGPRILITPHGWSPTKILCTRLLLVFLLFCFVFTLLWADRDGLRDQIDGQVTFSDVVYFTMITVTRVGYGDIVPVSTRARLLDALVVTPVRYLVSVFGNGLPIDHSTIYGGVPHGQTPGESRRS